MINSLSFRQNINNANTIQATPQSLKSYAALHAQPQRDEVCFKGLNIEKACKTLFRHNYDKETYLSEIRPIKILEQESKKEVEAYLAKTCNPKWEDTPGLAVFTEDGTLLGDIVTLDKDEWAEEYITNPKLEKIGKYLRVSKLDASHENGYKGVGTALVEAAKEESKKLGLNGQLRVHAYNDMNLLKGSPIPFYAKMGFVLYENPHLNQDEIIERYQSINPLKTMFLLTPETLAKLRAPAPPQKETKPTFKMKVLKFLLGDLV